MHARGDGSFGRSAGTQTLKGAGLLAVAVIIGIILLHTAPPNITAVSTSSVTPPTTKAPKAKTSHTTTTEAPLATTTTAPQAHPAAQVKVAVANGSGVPGLAGRIRVQLNSAGYNTSIPAVNAPAAVAATVIYYVAGYAPDADAIATGQLSLPASVVKPMPTPAPVPQAAQQGADVLVVAGSDIGGITTNTTEAPPGNTLAPSPTVSSKSTPTTTAHTATTTRTTVAVHTTTTVKKG